MDAGFLCDNAAVRGDTTNGTFCTQRCGTSGIQPSLLTLPHDLQTHKNSPLKHEEANSSFDAQQHGRCMVQSAQLLVAPLWRREEKRREEPFVPVKNRNPDHPAHDQVNPLLSTKHKMCKVCGPGDRLFPQPYLQGSNFVT